VIQRTTPFILPHLLLRVLRKLSSSRSVITVTSTVSVHYQLDRLSQITMRDGIKYHTVPTALSSLMELVKLSILSFQFYYLIILTDLPISFYLLLDSRNMPLYSPISVPRLDTTIVSKRGTGKWIPRCLIRYAMKTLELS
jgi:hypothetical protein